MRSLALFLFISSATEIIAVPIERRTLQPFASSSSVYSILDLGHENRSYFSPDQSSRRDTPSLHTSVKVGLRLYRGRFDLWGMWGVKKFAETVTVSELRPVVGVDYYAFESRYGQVMLFNHIEGPFAQPIEHYEFGSSEYYPFHGSIARPGGYIAGVIPFTLGPTILEIEVSGKAWTGLYSRDRQLPIYNRDENQVIGAVEAKKLERFAESNVNLVFSPSRKRQLTLILKAAIDVAERYRYVQKTNSLEVDGIVEKSSMAKASRLALQSSCRLAQRLILRNELQKNYSGSFSSPPGSGVPNYTNLVNLLYKF